ncbi:hypothetical protein BDZ89DRAFT_1070898 [Hymenopellis radicata]|nr:hypothetical protein BDZ89DRAFT_1070898 [Hymenopellis radicata]
MYLKHDGLCSRAQNRHAGSMRRPFSTHGSNVYPSVDATRGWSRPPSQLTASTWQEVVGARRLAAFTHTLTTLGFP